MNKEKVQSIFDESFKFQVNQELRHKADTKGHSADMGLLVLGRFFAESTDDDGNRQYEKNYLCRLVKFSGSGEQAHFREKELISVEEYEKDILEKQEERNHWHEEMNQIRSEVFAAYGVQRKSEVYLKDENGNVDKSRVWRVCGFSSDKGSGRYFLELREIAGDKTDREEIKIHSKDQIELI